MLALPKAELALCCQFSEDEEAGRRGQTLPAVVNDRAEAAPGPPVTTPAPPVTTPTPVAVTTPTPTSSASASPEQRSSLAALQAWIQKKIKSYTLGRAMYAGMSLLPILDMISDVALITYFYLPSGYWKSALVVWYIIYQSLRFITCYAPLHPKPSWRTLFLLYVPGMLLPNYPEIMKPSVAASAGAAPTEENQRAPPLIR